MRDFEQEQKLKAEQDVCNQAQTATPMQGIGNMSGSIRKPSTEEMKLRENLYARRAKAYAELAEIDAALSDMNDPSVQKLLRVVSIAQS